MTEKFNSNTSETICCTNGTSKWNLVMDFFFRWRGYVHEFSTHSKCCSSWGRNYKNTFCIWDVSNSDCEAMILFWTPLGTNWRCIDNVWFWFSSKLIPLIPCRHCIPNFGSANVDNAPHLDVYGCTHQVCNHFFHAIHINNTNKSPPAVPNQSIRASNIRQLKNHKHFLERNNQQPVAWTMYWKHFHTVAPIGIQWNRQTSMNWNSNLWPIREVHHQLSHHIVKWCFR